MKKSREYNPQDIEAKWQKKWLSENVYAALSEANKKKYYALIEFPYPSGDGLHVGHPRPYIGLDVVARKRRSQGYNVLYPIGWDAFGLPTENYAIKTGIHPKEVTKKNTDTFRRQIQSLGISFDWSREINTTDPSYYKWTQWIFLQLYKKGLAYKSEMPINWCLSCKIGLANEEVVNDSCERCGGKIEKRKRKQWMLAITKYADKLLSQLDELDYLPQVKTQQKNWIGKSEGALLQFKTTIGADISIFTTRIDTLFGVSFLVLAPEHPFLTAYKEKISNWGAVETYCNDKNIEQEEGDATKTGIRIEGIDAVNPGNGKEIPIFVSDYVLMDYGTGAIMGVPAHDERDHEFALVFKLPIHKVIEGETEDEKLIDSGIFDGLKAQEAKIKMTEYAQKEGWGEAMTTYKLRDWVFSRQRYWGEPIPIIFCDKCGEVPVPEEELPLELPDISNYTPTDDGDSPLAQIKEWVHVSCPKCKGDARRETDVMPNWAGSSWYFLRYVDPHNNEEFASKEMLSYFMPVDWYNGGMEHTTLHLLYSRFWNNFLYDIGVVPVKEPYRKRTSHGLILASGGEKMSKSKGNVINPDSIVSQFGADTLRVYEMFMGPFDQAIAWNPNDIVGSRKFLEKLWDFSVFNIDNNFGETSEGISYAIKYAIAKVSADIEDMKFNTAISELMKLLNTLRTKHEGKGEEWALISKQDLQIILQVTAPFAPHIADELWSLLGFSSYVHTEEWPEIALSDLTKSEIEIPIQINGKVRDSLSVDSSASEEDIKQEVLKREKVVKWLNGLEIKKFIYIKDKIVNIVV